jgi:hypothetical protein
MTWRNLPAAGCARGVRLACAPESMRAQGMPGARCTRSPCAGKHTVDHRSPAHPAFPAQWFDGFLRALLGDEFLLVTVASRIETCPDAVAPTHLRGAWHQQRMPGPHDFSVRSDLSQNPSTDPRAARRNSSRGVEAPFVCAPFSRSRVFRQPALRAPARPTLPRSTASCANDCDVANAPQTEQDGNGYSGDLGETGSRIFLKIGNK